MIETNIRLVSGGDGLCIPLREARLDGLESSPESLQLACTILRTRHARAAAPYPGHADRLLVASAGQIPSVRFTDGDLEIRLIDQNGVVPIRLSTSVGAIVLPPIVERQVLVAAGRRQRYWTLDSPRILWDADPFVEADGICAYRRYSVSAVNLGTVGLGIAVDVSTAFLTKATLAHFFSCNLGDDERVRREREFARLTGRQNGQKGTLVYATAGRATKCYFDSSVYDVTCATTGRIRPAGHLFESLADYYREMQPDMPFDPDGPVIRVSFPNLATGALVAAERVRARVMNDDLPPALKNVDKLSPAERRKLILNFWEDLGSDPLRPIATEPSGLWRPDPIRIQEVSPPTLHFGNGKELSTPPVLNRETIRRHFEDRATALSDYGCHSVPASFPRLVYVPCPRECQEAGQRFADDLVETLQSLTSVKVQAAVVPYDSISGAVSDLRRSNHSLAAAVVLNHEPNAYYDVAHQLHGWRIKRLTAATLCRQYRDLLNGVRDRQGRPDRSRGLTRWKNFVRINALEMVQLFDAVPYRLGSAGRFDAQVVIDVGHDRRHLALSLLLARPDTGIRGFRLLSAVKAKADHQHESINQVVLRDALVDIVARGVMNAAPLESLLVIRDGTCHAKERDAIREAVTELRNRGKLSGAARVDVIELHKDTLNRIRMWEIGQGEPINVLEGTILHLNEGRAIVAPTGRATLTQGTAELYLVVAVDGGPVSDAAVATLDACHLNWSSPRIANRWPITLKRTDDELTARAEQEIRRIK